ncbi:spermidine hydroxycinnamoyl transferase-like [Andrographis paniculata]|uniref:spermidine hydroxycinnamoyl transferase-like n=1 Tax=Andrographis paniculata TaxID=175694 RepID=UPI0021E89B17|nr:spermidine hydroxycinnamoyl transferase-like [Andrographis paniculata]
MAKKLRVRVKSSILVQPAEAELGRGSSSSIALSDFDLVGNLGHVPSIHFHRPSQNWLSPPHIMFHTLRASLAQLLVPYYPLAGRLRPLGGGRFEIVCNGAGALLVDAEADLSITMDEVSESDYLHLTPHLDIAATTLETFPLAAAQITRFACGGVTLAFALSHAVLDGRSSTEFVRQWGRLARGEPLEGHPAIDRSLLVNLGRSESLMPMPIPPEFELKAGGGVESSSSSPAPLLMPCSMVTISMTEFQVEALRRKANEGGGNGAPLFTRFEAITVHIWRCACRAWECKATRVSVPVDFRRQMGLPKMYVGNGVLDVVAACAGTATDTLSSAAGKLREAIRKVDREYLTRTAAYLKSVEDLSCFQDDDGKAAAHRVPTVLVTSWLSGVFGDVDFGWGREFYMSPVNYGHEGECVILPGKGNSDSNSSINKSIDVKVCLQDRHLEAFKKFFLQELSTPDPPRPRL